MAKFIVCPYLKVKYRDSELENNPVNIDLCTEMTKGVLAYYPDNIGKPTIEFKGCDARWVFNRVEERDTTLNNILGHN